MRIDTMYPSKYIKASDIGQRVLNLTISTVQIEDVGTEQKPEQKPVMYFVGAQKGLTLNRTNAATCEWLFGAETDDWVGKQVQMFTEMTFYMGEAKPGTRLRGVNATVAPAQASQTPPHQAPLPQEGIARDPFAGGPGQQAARAAQSQGFGQRENPAPDLDDDIPF